MSTKSTKINTTAKSSSSTASTPASSPSKKPSTHSQSKRRIPRVLKVFLSYLTLAVEEKDASLLSKALKMVQEKKIWSKNLIKGLAVCYKKLGAAVPSELHRQAKVANVTVSTAPVASAEENRVLDGILMLCDAIREDPIETTASCGGSEESSSSSAIASSEEGPVTDEDLSNALVVHGQSQSWADMCDEYDAKIAAIAAAAGCTLSVHSKTLTLEDIAF